MSCDLRDLELVKFRNLSLKTIELVFQLCKSSFSFPRMLQLVLESTDAIDSIDLITTVQGLTELSCNVIFHYQNKNCANINQINRSLYFPAPGPWSQSQICIYLPWAPIFIYQSWSPICFYRRYLTVCTYWSWPQIFITGPGLQRFVLLVRDLSLHLPFIASSSSGSSNINSSSNFFGIEDTNNSMPVSVNWGKQT